ncbi:MAG: hypothetical protein LC118_20260 [Dehalococcoidia bacterium]|nr:hypothetical protein [Dehalococcoidia bacterium]
MLYLLKRLPDAHALFERLLLPHVAASDLARRPLDGVFPDIARVSPEAFVTQEKAKPPHVLSEAQQQIDSLVARVNATWPGQYSVEPPVGIRWVRAFDQRFTPAAVKRLVAASTPTDALSPYAVHALEFGIVLALTFRFYVPDLEWSPERPLFDSALYDSGTETRIHVFHWAIKKLSSYGVSDGYPQKVCACLQWLRGDSAIQAAQRDLRAGEA